MWPVKKAGQRGFYSFAAASGFAMLKHKISAEIWVCGVEQIVVGLTAPRGLFSSGLLRFETSL